MIVTTVFQKDSLTVPAAAQPYLEGEKTEILRMYFNCDRKNAKGCGESNRIKFQDTFLRQILLMEIVIH